MTFSTATGVVRLGIRISCAALLLLALSLPAVAQNYPMPGHASQAPVICTTCPNYPYAPTWPYGSPLTSFIGRYVDSQLTRDYQAGYGMRTLRAGRVGVVPEHGRVYMIIGSTFASYDLDTFFSCDTPEAYQRLKTGSAARRSPGA